MYFILFIVSIYFLIVSRDGRGNVDDRVFGMLHNERLFRTYLSGMNCYGEVSVLNYRKLIVVVNCFAVKFTSVLHGVWENIWNLYLVDKLEMARQNRIISYDFFCHALS